MSIEEAPQTTLRETLETNMEAAEAGTLPSPAEVASQPRDEVGRFAGKAKDEAAPAPETAAPVEAPVAPQVPQRPSTWKKEYWPMWDKLATGVPLTPEESKKLADYNNQRENEYKTGVSTYRNEAMAAKEFRDAVEPFLPELQANGINPAAWIKSMGQAHYALAKGSPEQKLMVFQQLARQFHVPLGAVTQQQQPVTTELMGYIQALQQKITGFENFKSQQETYQQQQVMAALNTEISRFDDATKYPHFEAVRETMAQLLERGLAPDLDEAYDKAKWLVPEVREALQQAQTASAIKPQAVAQARARAVSPKSSTPSGQVASAGTKDRRSQIADLVEESIGGRL